MGDVRCGPFEGHALVPEAVVAWHGVPVVRDEGDACEEAKEVQSVGWGDDDAGGIRGGEEVEGFVGIILHCVADLEPATVWIVLVKKATSDEELQSTI